jgi:serine/threonine protein kinase
MPDSFDPYYQWLAIPPDQQPPNHYRLLGVETFEANPDVINGAADRQMTHVRSFQTGPRATSSQKMLTELAIARRTLLDPSAKSAYDTVLATAAPAECADLQQQAYQAQRNDTPAAPQQPLEPFGSYVVQSKTAASTMWESYKVLERGSGRVYSLKTLPAAAAKNDEIVKRFQREIEIVTKLDHPNLIRGVDSGQTPDGVPFLLTEHVMGTDLATLVARQGPLPVDVAVDYTMQAARALTQLHMHGVFHRNLKPQVLLVDLRGNIKITNLLMAKVDQSSDLDHDEDLTRQGTLLGTADFLAPDQASDASTVDGRADIYALGCVLHFLLTGRPPYPAKSLIDKLKAHKSAPIPNLAALRPDLPPQVQAAFTKMLAKQPGLRYKFVGEVVEALGGEPEKSASAPAEEPSMNLLLIAGGLTVVIIVLSVLIGLALARVW